MRDSGVMVVASGGGWDCPVSAASVSSCSLVGMPPPPLPPMALALAPPGFWRRKLVERPCREVLDRFDPGIVFGVYTPDTSE